MAERSRAIEAGATCYAPAPIDMRRLAPALLSTSLFAAASVAGAQPVAPEGSAQPSRPAPPTTLVVPEPEVDDDDPHAEVRLEVRVPAGTELEVPQDPDLPPRVERPASDGFHEYYVAEDARVKPLPRDPDFLTFSMHGEYQLRFRALSNLRLEPPAAGQLDGEERDPRLLGQNAYLYHWLRLGGRVQFRDSLSLVAQADVLRGLIVGDTTQLVDLARDPLADDVWYDFYPRELYLQYDSPIGMFRVGQQTSHWGQGLLANDGAHQSMFGDTIRGAIVERLLYATRPFGKQSPLAVAIAGDLVFEDNTADLLGDSPEQPTGDIAWQGILALMLTSDVAEIGTYGVLRTQSRTLPTTLSSYDERTTVGVFDVAGRLRGRVPGTRGYAYLAGEAAVIAGSSSYLRSGYVARPDPTEPIEDEAILSFGASTTFGYVHLADGEADEADPSVIGGAPRSKHTPWGDLVVELEWGYASGDADPFDGTTHRFTFDTNHNVGLVLFDHVLAWKTARAATIAQDPRIVGRPNPGLQLLPSQGGVFGATYLNPRMIVRPVRAVDVKLGVVVAQATADVVDPYQAGALGRYANFDGGNARRRDLGLELDAGVDARVPLEPTTTLALGVEGGVLFPGGAFDDARGARLADQYVLNTKLGLLF